MVADVIEGTGAGELTAQANVVQPYFTPMLAAYPEQYRDPAGLWTATRLSYYSIGYNTKLVAANKVPKTYADLLDPRRVERSAILSPPQSLRGRVRYVVMRNTKARNRFYNPGVGEWALRPVSGLPIAGSERVFPAGDWTRNGLDIVCMEAACLSAMRAARGAWVAALGPVPAGAPAPIPVLPPNAWYGGDDPWHRGTP